jgi:hypothetical protein
VLLLVVFGGVVAALRYKHTTQPAPEEVAVIVEEPETTPSEPEILDFDGLPKIVDDPERDGERPNAEYQVCDDSGLMLGDYEPAPKPKPPKPVAPTGPVRKPGTIVRELIANPVPNLYSASGARTADLLVIYTKEVKIAFGGPDNLLNHVNSMVAYTNGQFNGHKVKRARLRLVGLVEVDHVPKNNLRHDIGDLSAGKMNAVGRGGSRDKLAVLRHRTGGDLVMLLCKANKRGGGGLGMIKGPWSVMDFPYHAIFRHELQHNFGWNHGDRGNLSVIDRNFPQIAKWCKKRVTENKTYVQYRVEGSPDAAPASGAAKK